MSKASAGPRRIFLWSGYHQDDFFDFVRFSWQYNYLLICCPPKLNDFSFIEALPDGEISFCGNWQLSVNEREAIVKGKTTAPKYPNDAVIGIFTSGSTREHPKLVLYTRDNILSCQRSIFSLYDLNKFDQIFCYPQPYHVFGLLLGYIATIELRLKIVTGFGPYNTSHHEKWLACNNSKILTLATPVHFRDLLTFIKAKKIEPRSTYSCILGGARVDKKDWLLARSQLKIEEPSIGYGCTEASPGITHLPPGQSPQGDGDIGQVLAHTTISNITDKGYTCVSPSVAFASIENAQLSFHESLFVPDQLAFDGKTGRFSFAGRSNNIVNRGGEKFVLEHMESWLKNKYSVEALCVSVPDKRLGEDVAILMSKLSEAKLTVPSKTLQDEMSSEFGRKFPAKNFISVDSLPVNDRSKLDRKEATLIAKHKLGLL